VILIYLLWYQTYRLGAVGFQVLSYSFMVTQLRMKHTCNGKGGSLLNGERIPYICFESLNVNEQKVE
jgi:hypothetical protein